MELDASLEGDWRARAMADAESDDLGDLLAAAEKVSAKLGSPSSGRWSRWLRESVGTLAAVDDDLLDAIAGLGVPVLTTNYDGLLDECVGGRPATWRDHRRIQRIVRGEDRSVGHLHGYWDEPESVILGIRSYQEVVGSQAAIALQQALLLTKSLLIVGLRDGMADPNWLAMRAFLKAAFSESETQHYLLCRESELAELQQSFKGEQIVPLSYGADYPHLASFIQALRPVADVAVPTSADELIPPLEVESPLGGLEPSALVRVAVGVVYDKSRRSVVLVHRRFTEANLEWGFVAGFVNPYRDPVQQLCEEVLAETGLTCRVTAHLGERVHPVTGVNCVYFVLSVLDGELENGDSSENLQVGWVHLERIYEYIDRDQVFEPIREAIVRFAAE